MISKQDIQSARHIMYDILGVVAYGHRHLKQEYVLETVRYQSDSWKLWLWD